MIPPDTSRAFGSVLASPSPRLTEVDLAKIIDRTVKMAIAAKRQLGFAAVTTGCDGVRRTSMFDGSACQAEGDSVCIAERQDGITACLQVPMQGSGIVFQSISFRSVPCAPATGWYVLDDEGYLYKIPADLIVPVDYWPVETDTSGSRYDLVRSGSWATLMCAAPLASPTLHGEGGCDWVGYTPSGESSDTVQIFYSRLGGKLTGLETVPSVTPSSWDVIVSPFAATFVGVYGARATSTTVYVGDQDKNSSTLTAGKEYKALIYAAKGISGTATAEIVRGAKANIGAATFPTAPAGTITIAQLVVPYGGPIAVTIVGTTTPTNLNAARYLGASTQLEARWSFKGILIRDVDAPNAGVRHLAVTLPTADSGVTSGTVRVGFGYPFAFEILAMGPDENSPYGFDGVATPSELAARTDYDMAFVFGPSRLAIEYAPYHLNLNGPDIDDPADCEILGNSVADDIQGNIIQLPNGEVCLSRSLTSGGTPVVPQTWERYRVRPAPDAPVTIALSQETIPSYGADPNLWVASWYHTVANWTAGDTTFVSTSGPWTHGRDLPVVVWQGNSHWMTDADRKYGTIGAPTGTSASVVFTLGGGAPTRQVGKTCHISYLGPGFIGYYGWTFTINGVESALSPITDGRGQDIFSDPATATYTRTITVPLGPTGTDKRTIYRLAWDRENYRYLSGVQYRYHSAWDNRAEGAGAVYDRMMAAVGVISDNVTTEWVDDQTALSFAGTRPPQPLIAVGSGITMDTTRRVYALPPLNL